MIYTIYDSAEQLSRVPTGRDHTILQAIPEAPASWALIAPPLWLAFHCLWWPLAFYLGFITLSMSLLLTPFAPIAFFVAGLPGLYLWLEGRELLRRRLEAEKMTMVAVVDGDCEGSAIERYLYDLPGRQSAQSDQANWTRTRPVAGNSRPLATAAQMFGPFTAREI